jgi:hypothetical protein
VLEDISAVSQRIVPDEGRSEIGTLSYRLVDLDAAFTLEAQDKLLNDDKSFRGKLVRLYVGYEGMDFTEFQLFTTQVVKDIAYDEGVYSISCQDITREQRVDIFEPKKTTLRDSVDADDTTIPVTSTTGFDLVEHGPSYSDGPNASFIYFKIESEKCRATGKTADTFTGVTRGVLNTKAVAHTVDPGADADRRPKIEEVIYLELPAPKLAYAVLTGVLHGDSATLPDHWHCGIDTDLVRLADFTDIGIDLWDTTLDSSGVVLRFEGLTKTSAKKFLESELYMLMGCYSPIYSDGTIGLKRMNQVLAEAAYVIELNETNVVSAGQLLHDFSGMHNSLSIDWNWNGQEFTRENAFIDATSVAIHGESDLTELAFKGLHGSRHTGATIRKRLDAYRDRYSAPPERITVSAIPSIDRLEVGDIVRLKLESVRDFAGATTTINRSFEIQRKSQTHQSGDLEFDLFGSTAPASVEAPNDTGGAPALTDDFYTGTGTELSTVVTIVEVGGVGVIQPGTYDLTGHADMNNAAAIYYYDGDLELANGATLTVNDNVQIRAAGFFTINGEIDGVGRGRDGVAGSSSWTVLPTGTPGFLGNSRGMDGVLGSEVIARRGTRQVTAPCALTQGLNSTFPQIDLTVDGDELLGIPGDMRGTSGGAGGKTGHFPFNGTGSSGTVTHVGGTGGDSGAGLVIISRGLAFGASGLIDLSGADSAATSAHTGIDTNFDVYPGAGGAGCPGGLLILLDGSDESLPDIGGKFVAACGEVPVNGTPMTERGPLSHEQLLLRGWNEPGAGYLDESMISGVDLSNIAYRIQYIPGEETPQEDQDRKPPAPAVLFVEATVEAVRLRIGGVDLDDVDLVQFYSSATNDRTVATLVAEGKFTDTVFPILDQQVRYYWARTGLREPSGVVYSEWCPLDENDGATNSPIRGNFFCSDPEFSRATDDTHWYVLDGMSISPTGGTYGGYITLDFGATPSGDRVLVPRTDLLSINAGQSVSARFRLRRTSTITPVVKNCVLELFSFSEPHWPTAASSAVEVQATVIPDLQALPLNTWQDFTITVPTSQFGYPFARLRLVFNVGAGGTGAVDVDYFQAQLDAPIFAATTAGLVPKPTASAPGQQKLRDDGSWVHDLPRTDAEIAATVTPTDYSAIHNAINVKRFGVVGDGSADDTAAIVDAVATGQHLYFPPGTYLADADEIEITTAGQKLIGAGRGCTFIKKTSNGDLITISASHVTLEDLGIHNDDAATFTGFNVFSTGDFAGIKLINCNSFRSLSSCVVLEGNDGANAGHYTIRGGNYNNAPASAGTPTIVIGKTVASGNSVLYGSIDDVQQQPSGNPIQFNAVAGFHIIASQIGGWDNNVAGGASTVNSIMGCRITGDMSIEGADHDFLGNGIGAIAVTFESGSSGCYWIGNSKGAATITNSGGLSNIILERDASGIPNFLENFRVNNNKRIRFYDAAGTNFASSGMTSADNFEVGNNNGATQIFASGTNRVQLFNNAGATQTSVCGGGQLLIATLAADPVADVENGQIYYNTSSNKFRGRAGGAWVDLH